MILETKRLILRPWEESDAENLFKYASHPDRMDGRIYTFLAHLYHHRIVSDSRYVSLYARKAMIFHPDAKEDQWLLQKSEGAVV